MIFSRNVEASSSLMFVNTPVVKLISRVAIRGRGRQPRTNNNFANPHI